MIKRTRTTSFNWLDTDAGIVEEITNVEIHFLGIRLFKRAIKVDQTLPDKDSNKKMGFGK